MDVLIFLFMALCFVGESGWYSCKEMLFYFCLHGENFELLCGPITKAVYDVAYDDFMQNQGEDAEDADSLTKTLLLTVDHLAIQATRTQIQLLIETVRTRDQELVVTRNALDELHDEHEGQVVSLETQIQDMKNHSYALNQQRKSSGGMRTLTLPTFGGGGSLKEQASKEEDSMVVSTVVDKPHPVPRISPRSNTVMPK